MDPTRFVRASIVEADADTASDFLRFEMPEDKLFSGVSESAALLSYLRVELSRMRPGMADFLIRVSTPKLQAEDMAKKSNVMVTIRGGKVYSTPEGAQKVATVIAKQMSTRGDDTHNWESADLEHLGNMLYGPLRFFSSNHSSTKLQFSTDALA